MITIERLERIERRLAEAEDRLAKIDIAMLKPPSDADRYALDREKFEKFSEAAKKLNLYCRVESCSPTHNIANDDDYLVMQEKSSGSIEIFGIEKKGTDEAFWSERKFRDYDNLEEFMEWAWTIWGDWWKRSKS